MRRKSWIWRKGKEDGRNVSLKIREVWKKSRKRGKGWRKGDKNGWWIGFKNIEEGGRKEIEKGLFFWML